MKKMNFRKRLCCSVAAMLSLFAVCGNNLHAEEITYYRGVMDGSPEVQTVAGGSTITVSNMGINVPGYVIIGWHEMNFPVLVTSTAVENMLSGMAQYHAIGSAFTVTGDTALHAIWAIDADNNGYPDYGGAIVRPKLTREIYERIMAAMEEEMAAEDVGVSLRSLPAWDNRYDMLADYDSIYFTGCTYNTDPDNKLYEDRITFHSNYCFRGRGQTVIDSVMDLIIEYGGVLEEKSMIGGRSQKALDTIKITAAMVPMDVMDLFANYPFKFNSIKEDGQGILKMYFVKPDGTHPMNGSTGGLKTAAPSLPPTPNKPPFHDKDTTVFLDTLTIKFNIYNKPEFKSSVISQRVDTAGRIDLKHLSGTPLKYMMRCINGFRWRPADAPLTHAEQEEIWSEGATICLREMDKTIGYQMFQKEYYFSAEFNPDECIRESNDFKNECRYKYNEEFLDTLNLTDKSTVSSWYNIFYPAILAGPPAVTPAEAHDNALELALVFLGSPYDPLVATAYGDSVAIADWYTVLGQRNADAVVVPDPCRETFCLNFESKPQPGIQREVYIPQVAGVTTDPEYGTQYVPSQDDFHFTAKYTTANPLIVTTNRIVDGAEEVLPGTPNAEGGYDYVIRRVTQNIVLTFGEESVDNASIDGRAVWSYNNTINIRVAKEDVASIYSVASRLVKRIELAEGDNSIPAERGVYVVTLKDGSVHKVIVK